MPQGSNSERCSARLQIAEPSRWKSCKYRKRTILVNVVRDCYDPRRMGTYVLRFLRADDICDTIPAGWRHVLRSLQAKEMCYNSCRLTTYVLRSLQAEDICVFFERGNTHCSRYKRLYLSILLVGVNSRRTIPSLIAI